MAGEILAGEMALWSDVFTVPIFCASSSELIIPKYEETLLSDQFPAEELIPLRAGK